jgi:hypothetical protein
MKKSIIKVLWGMHPYEIKGDIQKKLTGRNYKWIIDSDRLKKVKLNINCSVQETIK